MNWTGGRLSRHSRNASVKDQQRQHFAKVRNNLLNGKANLSSIKGTTVNQFPGLAETANPVQKVMSFDINGHQPIPEICSSSITEKPAPHKSSCRSPSRARQENTDNRAGNDSLQAFLPLHRQQTSRTAVRVTRASYPPKTNPTLIRKHPRHLIVESEGEILKAGKLDEKRQNLLLQCNWTGLHIQRPLEIKFTSAVDEQMVGKRRRLSNSHRASYRRGQRIASPFAPRRLQQRTCSGTSIHKNSQKFPWEPQATREEIRIVIGGKEMRVAGSSTTSSSKKLSGLETSFTALPDAMLLDADQPQRTKGIFSDVDEDYLSDETHVALPTLPRQLTQRPIAEQHAFDSNLSNRYLPSKPLTPSKADDGYAPKHFTGNIERQPGNEDIVQIHHYQANMDEDCWEGGSDLLTDRSNAHLRTLDSPQLIGLSLQRGAFILPAVLHHPLPLSSKTSNIIRSNSVTDNSTAAQIGANRPVLPESQVLEDEIWKTWTMLSNDNELDENYSNHSSHNEGSPRNGKNVSISPGISALGLAAAELYEAKPRRSRIGGDSEYSYDQIESAESQDSGKGDRRRPYQRKVGFDKEDIQLPIVAVAKSEVLEGNYLPVDHKPKQLDLKGTKQGDPDDSWKRFIFTSDDEEDGKLSKNQFYESKTVLDERTGQPPASSVLANSSNETVSTAVSSSGQSSNMVEVDSSLFQGEPFNGSSPGETNRASHYIEISSSPTSGGHSPDLVAAHPQSKFPIFESRAHLPGRTPRTKIIFTKPKPFEGRTPRYDETVGQKEPVHIGRHYNGYGTKRKYIDLRTEDSEDIEDV